MRDCESCIHAKPFGGENDNRCGAWSCEYINRDEAIAIYKIFNGWIPLHSDGMSTDFPYERDGEWVLVTDGKCISVERIKKDAYDHFYPNGRWFEIDDVLAWMPLPEIWKGETDGKDQM